MPRKQGDLLSLLLDQERARAEKAAQPEAPVEKKAPSPPGAPAPRVVVSLGTAAAATSAAPASGTPAGAPAPRATPTSKTAPASATPSATNAPALASAPSAASSSFFAGSAPPTSGEPPRPRMLNPAPPKKSGLFGVPRSVLYPALVLGIAVALGLAWDRVFAHTARAAEPGGAAHGNAGASVAPISTQIPPLLKGPDDAKGSPPESPAPRRDVTAAPAVAPKPGFSIRTATYADTPEGIEKALKTVEELTLLSYPSTRAVRMPKKAGSHEIIVWVGFAPTMRDPGLIDLVTRIRSQKGFTPAEAKKQPFESAYVLAAPEADDSGAEVLSRR